MTIHHRQVPYVVVGFTSAHLRAALHARGPRRAARRFAAFTDWEVRWRYRVDEGQGRIAEATVEVSIQTVMPQWDAPRLASRALVVDWAAFVSALERHEAGHAEIACRAGARVRERLMELPVFATQAALDEEAAAVAGATLQDARDSDARYDAETDHGRRQGARLLG